MNGLRSNIQFNYLYRDAGNYKVWGYEVFSNPDSLELASIESEIKKSLIDEEFFDPSEWHVRRLMHDDWIPELDHTWNEYSSVESTDESPTVDYSVTDFLTAIATFPTIGNRK